MKKENRKYVIVGAVALVLYVLLAIWAAGNMAGDMIMPAVYVTNGLTTWYVMALTLVAEAAVIKWFLKEDWFKTAAITVVVNLVSTALGYVTLLLGGLIVELLFAAFGTATFHITHWIGTFLMVILVNAAVEGLTAKIGFKLKFRKLFAKLCLANALSLAICFLLNLSWTATMYM